MITIDSDTPKTYSHEGLQVEILVNRLLFNASSRGWDNYDGFDDILRIAINIAEKEPSHHSVPTILEQYGRANIVAEMKALKTSLNKLLYDGASSLDEYDKEALALGKVVIDAMIRQSLVIAETNRPDKGTIDKKMLSPENNGYWYKRIRQLTDATMTQIDEYHYYLHSKQFSHYLADTQKLLSLLCHDLGIQEVNTRQH